MAWDGIERRQHLRLSDDDKREIAERIYKHFQEHFQLQVGKITIRFILYGLGVAGLAALAWIKGWFK